MVGNPFKMKAKKIKQMVTINVQEVKGKSRLISNYFITF